MMSRRERLKGLKDTGTAVDAVYEVLRRSILDGELPPGHRLRSDVLANELKVSRTPVREALRKLETEGELYEYAVGALGRRMRSVAELKRLLRQRVEIETEIGQTLVELARPAVV